MKTYFINTVKWLSKNDDISTITVLCSQEQRSSLTQELDGAKESVHIVPIIDRDKTRLKKVIIEQLLVPIYCLKYRDHILFNQTSVSFILAPIPQLVTIQTALAVKEARKTIPSKKVTKDYLRNIYYDLLLPLTLIFSSRVVSVSQYLTDKVLEQYPVAAGKIKTIPEGVNIDVFGGKRRSSKQSSTEQVLFVGTMYKYKNPEKAIKAVAHANDSSRLQIHLKMVGRIPNGRHKSLKSLIKQMGVDDKVKVMGAIDHSKMPNIYHKASMLIYPSSAEAFGLPLLEAMAAGTPVIASNKMSIPNVVGDAGIIVEPCSVSELSKAVIRISNDESLRTELVKKGYKRATKLSWKNTSRQLKRELSLIKDEK